MSNPSTPESHAAQEIELALPRPQILKTRTGQVIQLPTLQEDEAIDQGIARDGETPELNASWFERAVPAADILPESMKRAIGARGPQKAPRKQSTTIRFDADVLAALKATGKGWQTRVNEAMREWVKTHPGG